MAGSRYYERLVVDVATEQVCPAREWTDEGDPRPHEIRAGYPRRGRPSGDPIWACIHCHVTWADLDAAARQREGQA